MIVLGQQLPGLFIKMVLFSFYFYQKPFDFLKSQSSCKPKKILLIFSSFRLLDFSYLETGSCLRKAVQLVIDLLLQLFPSQREMPFLMGPDSGHYNVEVKYEKKEKKKPSSRYALNLQPLA